MEIAIIALSIYSVIITIKYCIVRAKSANEIDEAHRLVRALQDRVKGELTDDSGQVWKRVE